MLVDLHIHTYYSDGTMSPKEVVEEAKKKLESTNKEEIEAATKELSNKIMPIGAKLYEQSTSPASDDKKEDNKDEGKEGPVEGEVVDDKK